MRGLDVGFGIALLVGATVATAPGCNSGGTRRATRLDTGGTDAGGAGNEAGAGNDGSGGTSGSSGSAGTGGAPLPTGGGLGDDCSTRTPCRRGLECVSGVCDATGSSGVGTPCVIQPECQQGLNCILGTCGPAGDGSEGDACEADSDCQTGLQCVIAGIIGRCRPQGEGDAGDACTSSAQCYGGLYCVNGACTHPGGITPWSGVDCEEPVAEGEEVRAYFEVPGADGAEELDFFRLPFPNDARSQGSRLDLSGFPTPGPGIIGVDPVKLYVDALEATDSTWGAYSTVFFRFSGLLDIDSLREAGSFEWVDITEGAPERGSSAGLFWYYSAGRTPYVCHHWLGVRRPTGQPMLPGHTYAVWLTTQVEASDGSTIARSPQLVALLDDRAPSDDALADGHAAFEPLRTYLDDEGVDPQSVLTATVITVGDLHASMSELAEAVADLDPPTASDWVLCDGSDESPCPDHTGGRDCGSGTADYDEYHALVSLPVFQEGTAPYLTPADGGGINVTTNPARADVCLSLTVPTGTPPSGGFPLVVFSHGTGGSFRSHVTPTVAGALSSGSTAFAVLGIDQVVHGTRRGGSDESPENLFFNFLNPDAARGNPLQGAADQLSLARFAATIDGTGDMPATIDPDRIFFFGHSQGSTHGSLMLPFGEDLKAAILSGNGAGLIHSLLEKTSPVDLRGVLPLALQDAQGFSRTNDVAIYHPALSLLQQWIDPADPLNFALPLGQPLSGHTARNTFMTYGLGDTFSPEVTMQAFAWAGRFLQAEPVLEDFMLPSQAAPVVGNVGMGMVTLGMKQYEPVNGSDGHFVAFDVGEANEDWVRFLSMAAEGEVPEVGE